MAIFSIFDIFSEPSNSWIVGCIFAVVLFVVQSVLCFKAEKKLFRRLPAYLIMVMMVFVAIVASGLLGKGTGPIGNVHIILATILLIVVGIASIGVIGGWIYYYVYKNFLHKLKIEIITTLLS
ncbi:hypothetical protein P261_02676 [Lachnospiraceae bacterium TWA4]|nr:hypothetical protein P261_02676 [Lachnospiraceae bacterium TWA4]